MGGRKAHEIQYALDAGISSRTPPNNSLGIERIFHCLSGLDGSWDRVG